MSDLMIRTIIVTKRTSEGISESKRGLKMYIMISDN